MPALRRPPFSWRGTNRYQMLPISDAINAERRTASGKQTGGVAVGEKRKVKITSGRQFVMTSHSFFSRQFPIC